MGSNDRYENIKGSVAVVYSNTISDKNLGEIKWSGAVCKAKLANSNKKNILKKGDNVKICSVKNNVFIVEKYY